MAACYRRCCGLCVLSRRNRFILMKRRGLQPFEEGLRCFRRSRRQPPLIEPSKQKTEERNEENFPSGLDASFLWSCGRSHSFPLIADLPAAERRTVSYNAALHIMCFTRLR